MVNKVGIDAEVKNARLYAYLVIFRNLSKNISNENGGFHLVQIKMLLNGDFLKSIYRASCTLIVTLTIEKIDIIGFVFICTYDRAVFLQHNSF